MDDQRVKLCPDSDVDPDLADLNIRKHRGHAHDHWCRLINKTRKHAATQRKRAAIQQNKMVLGCFRQFYR